MKEKFELFDFKLLNRTILLILLSVSFLYSAIIVLIESSESYHFLLIFMELIGITFLLFSISKRYRQAQKEIFEIKQNEKLIQMKNENQKVKLKNDVEIMRIRHEMKNQLSTLDYLLKEKKHCEASEFISGLYAEVLYKKCINTNNEVIDAICNNKIHHYSHIHFDFQIHFDTINIDNHDLISLLGNALDNAVEYLENIDDEKKIFVTIQQTPDFYVFIIKNNIKTNSNIDPNFLPTTKKNKDCHGFGLKIMKSITGKYNGLFQVDIEDNFFIVSILIPTHFSDN